MMIMMRMIMIMFEDDDDDDDDDDEQVVTHNRFCECLRIDNCNCNTLEFSSFCAGVHGVSRSRRFKGIM